MKDKILHEKVEYKCVREMIESVGDLYGDRVAFRYKVNPHDKECETKSYIQLRDDVRALATELLARGYKGKHIVVLGKQTYSWILTYFATLAMGAVLVPLDKDWGALELSDTVKTADTSVIFCDKDQNKKIPEICEFAGVDTVYYLDGEEGETIDVTISASDLCEILKAQFSGGYTVKDAVTGSEIKWESTGFVNKTAIQYVIKNANQ